MGSRETKGWREKVQQQLQVVQQWRQSGQSMAAWAAAHGVDAKLLMGWVAYEGRWLRRLQSDLVPSPTHVSQKANAHTVNVDSTSAARAGQYPQGFCGCSQRIAAIAPCAKPAAHVQPSRDEGTAWRSPCQRAH